MIRKSKASQKATLRVHNDSFHELEDSKYWQNSFFSVFLLILLLISLLLLAHTEKGDMKIALNALNTFDFKAIKLKNGNDSEKLYLIKCGSALCAIIDKDKNVILEASKNIIFTVKAENLAEKDTTTKTEKPSTN